MRVLRIDERSPYRQLIGVGGIGAGIFFQLDGNHTLGRNESRMGRLLDVRDYCKLHIVIHYLAKLLGAQTSGSPFHILPIGRVGADDAGRRLLKEMSDVGIDTAHVRTISECATLFSVCFQYPDGDGGNITTSNSASAALTDTDLKDAAGLVALGKRSHALAVPEVSLDVRYRFLQMASDAGAFRVGSFVRAEIGSAKQVGIFDLLDLVALNGEEAGEFAGCSFSSQNTETSVKQCQQYLQSSFPKLNMIISVGRGGAYGVTSKDYEHCSAPEVQVASTAGAGDSLLGGVLAALAAGIPLLRSDSHASVKSNREIASALELGVWLASYKCLSPHTIHPSVDVETLSRFAQDRGHAFSTQIQELVTDLRM